MFFVGIDLAWSNKNSTGLAILEGDKKQARLVHHQVIGSDDEIIRKIKEIVGNSHALISIDAPLTVPNKEGRRKADHVVSAFFRTYHAGAYPANRTRLSSWSGKIRGEEISKLLLKQGFKHDPHLKKHEKNRKFFEVFPHPSIVVLFKLDKILKYKSKPNRDYGFRYAEFKKYQNHLKKLENSECSLHLPEEITKKSLKNIKGKALKEYEDVLDAILCAYIGYYAWKKPEDCAIFGSLKGGYILTPVFEHMKKQIKMLDNPEQEGHLL